MTITIKPMTIEEFERMSAEGYFDPNNHVERLGGSPCTTSPISLNVLKGS